MNKQPFYHKLDVLFAATSDASDAVKSPEFLAKLEAFLKRNLPGAGVVRGLTEVDACDAEPGDPSDLL